MRDVDAGFWAGLLQMEEKCMLGLTGDGCVRRRTLYKSYVCDFSQTVLSGLLTPQRGYWIDCNTTQVRNNAGDAGGYCRLGLRLQVGPTLRASYATYLIDNSSGGYWLQHIADVSTLSCALSVCMHSPSALLNKCCWLRWTCQVGGWLPGVGARACGHGTL